MVTASEIRKIALAVGGRPKRLNSILDDFQLERINWQEDVKVIRRAIAPGTFRVNDSANDIDLYFGSKESCEWFVRECIELEKRESMTPE